MKAGTYSKELDSCFRRNDKTNNKKVFHSLQAADYLNLIMPSTTKMLEIGEREKRKDFKEDVEAYRHEADKRKYVVPVGLASHDTSKPKPKKYEYDLHLDPQLVWLGKKEHMSFEVPTVSINILKRITPS